MEISLVKSCFRENTLAAVGTINLTRAKVREVIAKLLVRDDITRWLSQRRALSWEFGGTNESPPTNMIVLGIAILPKVVLSFSWFGNKENDVLYKSSYSLWICLVYRLLLLSR